MLRPLQVAAMHAQALLSQSALTADAAEVLYSQMANAAALLAPLGRRGRCLILGDGPDLTWAAQSLHHATTPGARPTIVVVAPTGSLLAPVRGVTVVPFLAPDVAPFDVVVYTVPLGLAADPDAITLVLPTAALLKPGGTLVGRTWAVAPTVAATWEATDLLPAMVRDRGAQALVTAAPSLLVERLLGALDAALFGAITPYVHSPFRRRHVHDQLLSPLRALLVHGTACVGTGVRCADVLRDAS